MEINKYLVSTYSVSGMCGAPEGQWRIEQRTGPVLIELTQYIRIEKQHVKCCQGLLSVRKSVTVISHLVQGVAGRAQGSRCKALRMRSGLSKQASVLATGLSLMAPTVAAATANSSFASRGL